MDLSSNRSEGNIPAGLQKARDCRSESILWDRAKMTCEVKVDTKKESKKCPEMTRNDAILCNKGHGEHGLCCWAHMKVVFL